MIDRKNITNFDEVESRIECLSENDIFVSINVKEYYSLNFENKKFIMLIKRINVVDHDFTSSMLIISN